MNNMGIFRERKIQLVKQLTSEMDDIRKHRLTYKVEAGTEFVAKYLARQEARKSFPTEARVFSMQQFENLGDIEETEQTTFDNFIPERFDMEEFRVTLIVIESLEWWDGE